MKRKYLYLILGLFSFFIGFHNVDASTIYTGLNFDSDEKFNFYHELSDATPFYSFLKNTDFSNYFINSNTNFYSMFIFDVSEPSNYDFMQFRQEELIDNEYNLSILDIPEGAKYAIWFVRDFDLIYPENLPFHIEKNGNTYHLSFGSGNGAGYFHSYRESIGMGVYQTHDRNYKLAFYTDNADLIDIYDNTNINVQFDATFSDTSYEDSAEFSYLISSVYHLGSSNNSWDSYFTNQNLKLAVPYIHYMNEKMLIDNTTVYNSLWGKIKKIFTSKTYTVDDTDMDFFRDNAMTSFKTLYHILSYNTSSTVIPSGYSSISLGFDSVPHVLFIPKSSDTSLNHTFYTSTDVSSEAFGDDLENAFKLLMQLYTYDKSNNIFDSFYGNSLKNITYKKTGEVYTISLKNIFINEIQPIRDNINITDVAVYFGFGSSKSKYFATIYYNPNAYSYCLYGSSTNSCTYIDADGVSHTLTKSDLQKLFTESVFEVSENDNSSSDNYNNGNWLKNIITNVENLSGWVEDFASILAIMFGFMGIFINSLPIEIQSVLLFGFVGGLVIIIVKILRGS